MDRATIHYLHQKGWTKVEIAAFVGHHRDTITRVLREPLDQRPAHAHERAPLRSSMPRSAPGSTSA